MITKWLFKILIFFFIFNICVFHTFSITSEKILVKSQQITPPPPPTPTTKQPKQSVTGNKYKRSDEKTAFIAGILVRTLPDGNFKCIMSSL